MMASVNRQVQISDVLKSLEAHVDGFVSSSKSAQRICELNLHQKMFISCLRKIKIDSPNLKIPVSVLYGRYASTAISLKILEAVGRSEFIDLLVNAESMGVISLSGGPLGHGSSSGYRRKNAILNEPVVCLTVSPDDVALALKDTSIIL